MPEKVIMPKSGMSMEFGTIIRWLKNEGDTVNRDEPILEIETDKLTMEVEAESSGVLLKKLYEEGDVVPVVTTIAWIGQPGEAIPEEVSPDTGVTTSAKSAGQTETATYASSAAPACCCQNSDDATNKLAAQINFTGKIPATPVAKRLAKEHGIDLSSVTASGKSGEITKADIINVIQKPTDPPKTSGVYYANATPLARRIAESSGVSTAGLSGTGPAGKIYARDIISSGSGVNNAATTGQQANSQVSYTKKSFAPISRKRSQTASEKLTGMRKVIAERMFASHTAVPAATLRIEVDADPIFHLRAEYNRVHGTRITFNDLILRATILTLNEFPELNAHIKTNTSNEVVVSYNESINLGVAISVNRGLLVPVIKDAESLTVCEISGIVKDLSERAKNNRLKPDELSSGTFTVTNLGMFDIVSFTPIINLPEVAILGVCAIVETPVIKNGAVTPGRRMGLCLTHDHRLIDGALAASFLQRVKELIESPLSLL
ncbi:MAG: 2-oxo acid dehydrogenase subunit E2 [Thermoguttaceae bacterium]